MADITQTISNFPAAPDSQTDSPSEFNAKADAFVNHQSANYVGEVNTWAGQANSLKTDMNTIKSDIDSIVATLPAGAIDDVIIAVDKVFSNSKTEATYAKINDSNIDSATTYSSNKIDTTYAKSGTGSPAGALFDFAGASAPAGSLACNGQELLQATYPALYSAIGDLWATTGGVAAPTAGNFRLPPQEIGGLGLYNRGVGATNGVVGTYQEDVFKSHSHSWGNNNLNSNGVGAGAPGFGNSANATSLVGDATETRPRSLTVLKCIWTGV